MPVKIFRWKAIGPLALFLVLVGVLLWLFAEPIAKDTTEEVGTELLGTQVDLGSLDISADEASVEIGALQIADPFDSTRNLVQAERIQLKLNPLALAEKKFVVDSFRLGGMRFGTTRQSPARPVKGDGFAPQALRSVRQWAQQFDVPILKLTPFDTVKQLVLNPAQLTTVRAARALAGRVDSARSGLERSFQQLDVSGTVDTAEALVARLRATDARKLGVDGTRQAIEDARASLARLEDAKRRVETLQQQVTGGVGSLTSGLEALDEARRKDYAFARSLLQLPSFSAPEIGQAFFGKVSVDRFQQALYYTELARHYMPPGLLPKRDAGPQRLRASGRTIRFPKEHEWPKFLMRLGRIDLAIEGDSPLRGVYEAAVQGLTSDPSLYGQPTLVRSSRRAAGSAIASMDVRAVIDHVHPERVRDSASARLRGVSLPNLSVPGTAVPRPAGRRGRRPRVRAQRRSRRRPLVHQLRPGRLGARQHRAAAQRPREHRVAGGVRAQAAVGGRARERKRPCSATVRVEQSRPRHRPAARGRHRRRGGQGGEAGPRQSGQRGRIGGGAGSAPNRGGAYPGRGAARIAAGRGGGRGAPAAGRDQAPHRRPRARNQAAQARPLTRAPGRRAVWLSRTWRISLLIPIQKRSSHAHRCSQRNRPGRAARGAGARIRPRS